tara:strand:+ start:7742 stop:8011 length:270 start_codon:yes stop_codon:yes gene_type:complete
MNTKKIDESVLGAAVAGLVGGYIISRLKGDDAKARKIANKVTQLDNDIAADLRRIDKKVKSNKRAVQKQISKMSSKDRARIDYMLRGIK